MIDKRSVIAAIQLMDQFLGQNITDHALRQSELDRGVLADGPGFVPLSAELKLIEAAARKAGERHLGLKYGASQRYADLGPYAQYVLAAPDLAQAIQRGTQALPFVQPGGKVHLRSEGPHTVLSYDLGLPTVTGIRHIHEAMPFLLRDLVRNFAGSEWQPEWVETPCSEKLDYESFGMCAPVRYNSAHPGIALDSRILRIPNTRTHMPNWDLADLAKVAGLSQPKGLADRVRAVLPLQAAQQDLSVDATATRLALGVRSLERQLQLEGTSFREIKQKFLCDRACRLLSQPGANAQEVANLLGYREPNSFRRAFRNWTGQTPAAFAAKHQSVPAE